MIPLFFVLAGFTPQQPTASADASSLDVPLGAAIDLDGKIGDDEWKSALRLPLGDGGALFLRHDAQHVYAGVRGKGPGLTHVYLQHGDEVVVRHASAALGTAIYARNDAGKWRAKQSFPAPGEWALRETALTPDARSSREKFLEREGWVATNMAMGKGEFELVLARKGLGEAPVVAFAYAPFAGKPLVFPPKLADGCTSAELLMGNTPSELAFAPETWARLRLAAKADSSVPPKK